MLVVSHLSVASRQTPYQQRSAVKAKRRQRDQTRDSCRQRDERQLSEHDVRQMASHDHSTANDEKTVRRDHSRDFQLWERVRLAFQLHLQRVNVIEVNVGVANRVDEIPRLQVAAVGDETCQQGVRRDVEGDAETHVRRALIHLVINKAAMYTRARWVSSPQQQRTKTAIPTACQLLCTWHDSSPFAT